MNVGLLGGTFDPVHVGHLRAAETAREALDLDLVLFAPARTPPHRSLPATSALDRYAMVCLATAGNPAFVAADLELHREGPSYTVDTLSALSVERPGDLLTLIVGSDTFPELMRWKDAERLLSLCEVAVVSRPGERASGDTPEGFPTSLRARQIEGPGLDVSSTAVRSRLLEGESVRYLVPDAVSEYIAKRRLYR